VTRCYAWPLAVLPGENLKLHVSTSYRRFGVRLFRYGARPSEVAGDGRTFEGAELSFGRPDEAWGWPEFQIEIGQKAPDGVYLAVPVEVADDGTWDPAGGGPELLTRPDACLFLVRRQPSAGRDRILVKLPAATYSAYNQLGGTSLYAGARWAGDWNAQGYVVSLQRPGNGGVGGEVMAGDAPDVYQRSSRRQTFAHWDAPLVAWLEGQGYEPAYCTDFDLHDDDDLLTGVSLLICSGHDEYWSAAMRTRVLEFVSAGGNVCFFAGDVAEWEIDLAPAGDRLFCRKMKSGPPSGNAPSAGSAIWHFIDPEDWLTMSTWALGGGWWDGHRAIDGFQPAIPSHWVFDGVQFPADGITGGLDTPVIGYEVDGVALARRAGPPGLSEQRRGGNGRLLLAAARLSPGWEAGYAQANAAMMFRTAPSGGMVFSVGTTDWSVALAADEAVATITGNAVRRLSCPSLRIRGPVCPDGEYLEDADAVGPDRAIAWHLDGSQASALGLTEATWSVSGSASVAARAQGPEVRVSSGSGEDWLTVTATAKDSAGRGYFGSRTVQVLGREEYLRRRIVRTMHAMAYPDEQGGSLVDQRTSEASLAGRVIPIRLRWVRSQMRVLAELAAELEALWESSGRITDGDLEADLESRT
jgi:hypothetical protein